MISGKKTALWIALVLAAAGTVVLVKTLAKRQPVTLKGAIIRQDADPRKELPIAEVEISAGNGLALAGSRSDSSGLFILSLPKGIRRGHPVKFRFRHPEYQPLDVNEFVGDKIYVVRMLPIRRDTQVEVSHPQNVVTNVVARYSIKATTAVNVGSAGQTFEVANTGNAPCNGQPPCSPDGKWKASMGSASLDAGDGNEFRNVRASCIAGPCPFTKIEDDSSREGRYVKVSARNWSDTATFLLEAEVFHPMVSDIVRQSYPVIFGPALNFTMPAAAEGVTIEADINGTTIIFPLGPNLFLSWADCNARVNSDQTKVYRCELKPGYRFP